MCNITKLHCEVCQANSRHLFLPCGEFLTTNLKEDNGAVKCHIEPGKRFYCSELKWPLNPDEDNSHWVCNACLESGRKSYQDSIDVVKRLSKATGSQSRCVSLMHRQLLNSRTDSDQNAEPAQGHLPMEFCDISATTRKNLISLYASKVFPDHVWEDRDASSGGCHLTVWMPCCPVCQDPMVDPDKEGGIVDVEFEPTSELWRWLAIHQRLVPEEVQAFEVTVATGFIGKVCEICVNMETVLRQQVKKYLQDTTRPRSWAVVTWLLNRGMLDKPFYDFSVPNLGFPDTTPPTDREIMGLMTKNWERLTNGIAFGDCIVDSAPPVSYSAPLTRHQEPLMHLSQWIQLIEPQSNKQLNVNNPPPPLDLMVSDPSVALLLTNMSTDGQSDMDHDLDTGAQDCGGHQEHRAFNKAYIDGARISSTANIDGINDGDSVSSDASYTLYQPPPNKPEFHFLPDKPRSYMMPHLAFYTANNIHVAREGPKKTTDLLEKIAIGSIDPYIALWHLLSEFMTTPRQGKGKRRYGILETEWIQVHQLLETIAKFAATVWKDPKKKYKSENALGMNSMALKPYTKVIETLLKKVARKSGYSSEVVELDMSEAPIGIVADQYPPIEAGLLDLYVPDISFSEGVDGSLIATIQGLAVYNAEWITQRHRIQSKYRKIFVWKFTAPDFEESFEAAAKEGLFMDVMRRSLFGETKAGLMHGEHRVTAHGNAQEASDNSSRSVARVETKDVRKASALASKRQQPSEKHVHFASSPDVSDKASPHKPWWEIDQDSAEPSTQKQPNSSVADDDASMADADDDSDVVDLDDGHGGFVLCDKGGWHYLDEFGSLMGELVSLPGLGLEISSDEIVDELGH